MHYFTIQIKTEIDISKFKFMTIYKMVPKFKFILKMSTLYMALGTEF